MISGLARYAVIRRRAFFFSKAKLVDGFSLDRELAAVYPPNYNVTLLESGDTWKVSRSDKPTCIALEVSPTVWRHFPGGAIIWKCWFFRETQGQNSRSREENQHRLQALTPGLELSAQWWEANALSSMLPLFLISTMYVTLTVIWSGEGRFLSPLGGGGGSRPSLIFSCFSFSISLRRWVRIFFLSFFVNMIGTEGASLGSASCREKTHEKTKEI